MAPATQAIGTDAVLVDCGDELGEGPVWDAEAGVLRWVDLLGAAVQSWDPATGEHRRIEYAGTLGAVIPRRGHGPLIAAGRDLVEIDDDGTIGQTLVTVDPDRPENRLNDCRCDTAGRLWAGTMSSAVGTPGEGSVYRIGADLEPRQAIAATTISNGIGWDPADHWMYFIDSATYRLDAFEFDPATGSLGERRTVARIDPDEGLPDGLAVDAEGGIWVALFGGGRVNRYTPDGELDQVLRLPFRNPTCPAFGGAGMETLFITTARYERVPAESDGAPRAGALLALDVGVPGLPPTAFA
jgi:sugar lactone lactonase YvrE